MDPKRSVNVYPRIDEKFKKKKSYNFDMMKTNIMMDREEQATVEICKWFAYALIGIFTGILAFLMSLLEDYIVESRSKIVEHIFEKTDNNLLYAWLFLAGFCAILAMIGSAITVYFGPGANGSGMAEIMAVLNGVNYPKFIGWDTLFTKSLCVVIGIGASLCIGKEGPLAHIGAIVAVMTIYYIPIK